jgi:hypothetical protein
VKKNKYVELKKKKTKEKLLNTQSNSVSQPLRLRYSLTWQCDTWVEAIVALAIPGCNTCWAFRTSWVCVFSMWLCVWVNIATPVAPCQITSEWARGHIQILSEIEWEREPVSRYILVYLSSIHVWSIPGILTIKKCRKLRGGHNDERKKKKWSCPLHYVCVVCTVHVLIYIKKSNFISDEFQNTLIAGPLAVIRDSI